MKSQMGFGTRENLRRQLASWAKPHLATWASPGPVELKKKKKHYAEREKGKGWEIWVGVELGVRKGNGVVQRQGLGFRV